MSKGELLRAERLRVEVAPELGANAATPAAAAAAAAAGVLAVDTDRRNLLWYEPPTVGGEERAESVRGHSDCSFV